MLGHENSEKDPSLENRSKIPGFCTGEGTRRYKERAVEKLGIPDDLLRERITKKSCLFSGDDTEQSIIFSDCKHVVVSCDDCTSHLHSHICIICRCVNKSIDKAYICT